jgi:hypothetical protein
MKFQRRQGGPATVAGRTDSSNRSERGGAQCVSEQAGPDRARGLVKSPYFCGPEPADGSYHSNFHRRNTDQQKLR